MLPAGHRVPHTGTSESFNILHNNKGFLLQGDNGQVVVVKLGIAKGVEPWPHWVFKCQAAIVKFAHLLTGGGKCSMKTNRSHAKAASSANVHWRNDWIQWIYKSKLGVLPFLWLLFGVDLWTTGLNCKQLQARDCIIKLSRINSIVSKTRCLNSYNFTFFF